ncbi:DUF6069 family protein [Actinoplanes sp. NBC_00393]|uniref:DUF6069 family protein n=1 Tax=Actinoplanes sp. NBC_00393 TaxID=2975953 RepID=UPI002E205FF0
MSRVVAAAAALAVVVNLAVYLIGRAAGGTYTFTSAQGPAEVDAVTVAGFSLVPLLVGLTVVALLASRAAWVVRAALIIGPVLAVGTIVVMTLPTDFDGVSKTALAVCHLTLVPIIVVAVTAIGRRAHYRASSGIRMSDPSRIHD